MRHTFVLILFTAWLSMQAYTGGQAQWTQTAPIGTIQALAMSERGILFAASGDSTAIFVSSNYGANWRTSYLSAGVLAASGAKMLAGTAGGGLFVSSDDGVSWISLPIINPYVYALVANGPNILVGCRLRGIIRSTDAGMNWMYTNVDGRDVGSLLIRGQDRFAAECPNMVGGGGVDRSTDSGANWFGVNSSWTCSSIAAFGRNSNDIFAGTRNNGVLRSSNDGIVWEPVNTGLTNPNVSCFADTGISLFVGTSGGVFLSQDNGEHWVDVSSNMTYRVIKSLVVSGGFLFAGTTGGGVWRRPLSEMIVEVDDELTDIPERATLFQNFPNPFNPTTDISFILRTGQFVSLSVYDLLGREIATLISKQTPAGHHSVKWNPTGVPSGVYFYRIHTGSFDQTKKLILLK